MLHKLKNNLLGINIAALSLIAIITRSIIQGSSIGDAVAVLAVCSLYGYTLYLKRHEVSNTESLEKQVADLHNAVQSLQMKHTMKRQETANGQKTKRYF